MISSLTHQGQQPAVRGAEAAYADEAVAEDVLQLAHLRAHTRQAQPCARMHTMHMRMRMHMHIHMHMHIDMHMHIHMHMTCTCTCTHMHMHIHMY